MLHHNRINIYGRIDVDKASASKECIICHYWYFLDKIFRFQPTACNDCHDVLMMSIDINNIAILNIHSINYCCIIF